MSQKELTLGEAYKLLVDKFDSFVRSIFMNHADVMERLDELAKTPMVIVCLAIKGKIKPYFKDNKIEPKAVKDLFKIDISGFKPDQVDKMNNFIEAFVVLADEALGN